MALADCGAAQRGAHPATFSTDRRLDRTQPVIVCPAALDEQKFRASVCRV